MILLPNVNFIRIEVQELWRWVIPNPPTPSPVSLGEMGKSPVQIRLTDTSCDQYQQIHLLVTVQKNL